MQSERWWPSLEEPGAGWRWVSALVLVSKGNGKPLQPFKQGDR